MSESDFTLPSAKTLQHAAKMSITEDKEIKLDYWLDSLKNNVMIGVKDNNEKLLVRSEDEYTSPIGKIYKTDNNYIIATENSIYVVASTIPSKRIS